jgi:hypothetical protein
MRATSPSHPNPPPASKYTTRACSALPVHDRQRNQPDIPMPFHALGGDKDKIWERTMAAKGERLAGLDMDEDVGEADRFELLTELSILGLKI